MILQYIESSVDSHFIVVPNIPKIPDPKIPPFCVEGLDLFFDIYKIKLIKYSLCLLVII
jgi:hypothetical protein